MLCFQKKENQSSLQIIVESVITFTRDSVRLQTAPTGGVQIFSGFTIKCYTFRQFIFFVTGTHKKTSMNPYGYWTPRRYLCTSNVTPV